MIGENNESGFGDEDIIKNDSMVVVLDDEYNQANEFSPTDEQSWDSDFCQLSYDDARGAGIEGQEGLSDGDMVVLGGEYSQEPFSRDRSKQQKSNKSELDDVLKNLNKRSGRGRKKQIEKPLVSEKVGEVSMVKTLRPMGSSDSSDSNGVGGSDISLDNNSGVVKPEYSCKPETDSKSNVGDLGKSVKKIVAESDGSGPIVKRKYDKEGKKVRVETITRCVIQNFSDKDFTLSDVKDKIREQISQWEMDGVSNIDVELSVCVKSMGVEIVGQAPRPSGQRGRPSNIMRLIASK